MPRRAWLGAIVLAGVLLSAPAEADPTAMDPGRDPEMETARRAEPLGWGGVLALSSAAALAFGGAALARRRPAPARVALVLGGLLTGALVAEAGLRASVDSWAYHVKIRDGCYHSNPRGYLQESRFYDQRDIVAFCAGRIQDVWKTCEAPLPRDGDAPRLMAVGDSFTDGVGVFARDTWPAQLATRMGSSVVNCGRASLGATAVARRFLDYRPRHDPDVVVYALVLNDVPPPSQPETVRSGEVSARIGDRAAFERLVSAAPLLGPVWRQSALGRLLTERLVARAVARDTVRMYQQTWADPTRAPVVEAFDVIAAMSELAAEHDARFLVAIWPLLFDLDAYDFADAHATIRRELESRGVAVLDLLPAFEGRDVADLQVHPTDHHPNDLAHALAADAIAEALRAPPVVSP